MPNEDYDIVGSYNSQQINSIDGERSVNLFEYIDIRAKKPKSLISTSGIIDSSVTFGATTGGFRSQFVFNDISYNVIGNKLYLINPDLTKSLLGTFANTSSGYVGIDANTFQIIFVDGIDGYIWDTLALTFNKITDTSFPTHPIDVTYLDGFFIVANGQTNTFQLSSLNQGMVWGEASNTFTASAATDLLTVSSTVNYQTGIPVTLETTGTLPAPLNTSDTYFTIFASSTTLKLATSYINAIAGTAINLTTDGTPTNTIVSDGQLQLGAITSQPGTIVACRTLHRRLFLFSQYFTEVWENSGLGTNLPIRRNNSLLMEYGTPAIASIDVGFDMMIFLSQDRDGLGSVMKVTGTESRPISNRALDSQLAKYSSLDQISDCNGFLVRENALIFYRMNFTEANHTFVYNDSMSDSQTFRWHEEEILNGDRHPSQTHIYFNGKNYYGDYKNPIMYLVSNTLFTNNGEAIRRMRISRPIVPGAYNRIRIDRLQIDLLQGSVEQIDVIDNNNNPNVFLSISKDGGQTYGYLIQSPMGKVGQRSFRTVWRKLGVIPRGQAFVIKTEFFSAIPYIILGAAWSYEVLPE